MSSLSSLLKERGGPYSKPFKVKVVAVLSPQHYTGRDGADKSSLTIAVSDGETVLKAICYDSSKYAKLKVGNSIVIREVITKSEDGHHIIVMTKTSKVLASAPLEVDQTKFTEGEELIRHRPAESLKIAQALTSPLKKRVSVMGRIVQEDEPQRVNVRGSGSEVKIKKITIEDSTGKAKVTLWRTMADTTVRPGDFVKITDVVTNVFNNTTTLQTTSLSAIEKCDAPIERKIVEVEAVGVEEEKAELYLSSGEIINVPLPLLQVTLGKETKDEVELCTASGPITLEVEISGADTIGINLMN